MKKEEWKKRIISACEDAGTYRAFFDAVIDSLAGIMESRDTAQERYEASGGSPVTIHVNKAKEKNIVKNPALVMVMDLNTQALSYWRDLGLTPAGYKKLNADVVKSAGAGNLEKALSDMLGE